MIIKIRKMLIEDADKIVKWRNKSHVLDNFLNRTILTTESHISYYHSRIETGEVIQFIIMCDDLDIGTVFLRDIDNANKKAEFGIFIGEESYLGKGIGPKAIFKILNFGFNDLDLNKIYLRVLKKNERAIRSYKKSGFKIDGCFREDVLIDNCFEDVVFMSVIKKEN